MAKLKKQIQIFSKLTALWLFVSIWWGLSLLTPLQPYNEIIRNDLPLLFVAFILCIIIGFYYKQEKFILRKDMSLLISIFLFFVLALVSILHLKEVTFSLILLAATLYLFSYVIDLHSLKKASWFLFSLSIGLAVTKAFMNSMRGKPEVGINFFCPQISIILSMLGVNSRSLSGTLMFNGKKITCDFIKLGFYPWLAFTLGFCILIVLSKSKLKRRLITLVVALIIHYLYLLLRFAYYCLRIPNMIIPNDNAFHLLYWRFSLLSFLPLLLLWYFILQEIGLPEIPLLPRFSLQKIRKKDLSVGILLLLTVISFALYRLFPGFVSPQKVHIVIDEIHSRWESSLIDFNQETTGVLVENSYHSLLDYLHHFYQVSVLTNKPLVDVSHLPEGVKIINADNLNDQLLAKIGAFFPESKTVLILKCITTPFAEDEIEAIKDFVYAGGNVFLIGDHTDIFFMNKNLNELSEHFGIKYRQNSAYFVDGGWIITDPGDYPIHPVTTYMDKFIWATGDTLDLRSPAYPLTYSPVVCFADHVNYFFESFIGNTYIDAEEVLGSFCVLAGSEYGQGKIIAFTDSTCFNNYLMFTVGRREMLAGIMGWFGTERLFHPFFWLTWLLIFCLIIFIIKTKPDGNTLFNLLIMAIPPGFIIGILLANSFHKGIYHPPKPVVPLPTKIIIDASHNPAHCLSFGDSHSFKSSESYDYFTLNIGRTDLFPEIIYKDRIIGNILDEKGCLIIISPRKEYTKEERETIFTFVVNGGSLLLIEGANQDSTINQIADLFDIHLRLDPYRDKIVEMKEKLLPPKEGRTINPVWVDGGETLFSFQNMPIISCVRKGKGLLTIIGDDTIFMKNNPGSYLVRSQTELIKALVKKDIMALKSINWNYLAWE